MDNRRETLANQISRETDMTDAMIATLVDTFYKRVRNDPLAGSGVCEG
jgi:truncated hemoglobin YjbI